MPAASVHDDLIHAVKSAVSLDEMIESLGLRRRGRSLQCPNHRAHKHGDRSMSAWISSSGHSWRCYGCGASGTVLDLVMAAKGYSVSQAALAIADYAGLPTVQATFGPRRASAPAPAGSPPCPADEPSPLTPPAPVPATPDTAAFLRESQRRLPRSDHAKGYLARRGIPMAVAIAAGLGFAPRGSWPHQRAARQPRIVAPLTSPDGTLLTLYGRSTVLCEKPLRHDFLPGTRGIFHAASLAHEDAILVEGVFDALACLAGGRQAAAICGLTMREDWWPAIPARRLILALDADTAGQRDAGTLARAATRAGKTLHIVKGAILAPHKDLNEYWVARRALPGPLQA